MSLLKKLRLNLILVAAVILSCFFTFISFSKSNNNSKYVLNSSRDSKENQTLALKAQIQNRAIFQEENIIQVIVDFKTVPTAASSSFAPLKYNKDVAVRLEFDDGSESVYTNVFKKLNGGVATNGVNYPATSYTDGAGKNINFRAGAAVFSINSYNGIDVLDNYQGKVTWTQLKEMVAADWAIINHQYGGADHSDRIQQIHDQNKHVYAKLKALGIEFRPRTLVVPAADEGYTASAFELGMVLSSSEFGINQQDNFPFLPNDWSGKALVSSIPLKNTTLKRSNLGDAFLNTASFKKLLDESLANSTAVNKYHIAGFSHGPSGGGEELDRFVDLMDYIKITGNDRVWVPNTQEFYEYLEVKNDVIKTETISGNKLIITLDLSKVSQHNRFRDMSLLINSSAEINNVTVTNADGSTYNATTNLINIYKQKTTFTDPALDKIPPRIVALSVENLSPNKVNITYDRPVTQNIHTAYNITNGTVQSISGVEKNWQLTLTNNITPGSDVKLSYRMQNGNATDSADPSYQVGSYINKKVENNLGTENNPLPLAPHSLTATLKNDQNHVLLNWADAASNENGFEIFRSAGNEAFTLLSTVNANIKEFTDISEKPNSDLKYKIKAVNGAGSSEFSNEVSIKIVSSPPSPPTSVAYRIFFNFTNDPTGATGYWNNIASPKNDKIFANLKNDKSEATSVGIKVTSAWDTWWNAAGNHGLWNNSLYPIPVSNTAWAVNNGQQSFKITGLNPQAKYSLDLYSAAKSSGTIPNYTSNFTVNTQSFTINSLNNINGLIAIKDILANNSGEINISLSNVSGGLACINALVLNASDETVVEITEPVAPGNLSGIYLRDSSVIKLSWMDNANNETGYEIFRSRAESNFELLASLDANSTNYRDTDIGAATNYKYKVRAKNSSLFSLFSNEFVLSTPATVVKQAYKIYINFANNSIASGYWNNIAKPKNQAQFNNFKDAQLNPTSVGLKVTSSWEVWWNAAGNNGIWNNSLYPIEVANTTWSTNSGPQTFKLTGLEPSMIYDLSFYSTTKSKNADYTSTFTVNSKKIFINAANNISNLVVLKDLKPSLSGELAITISNNVNGIAVVNALIVDAKSAEITDEPNPLPPPPTSESTTKVKINFNGNSWNAASGWNNTSSSPLENYALTNLKDHANMPTNLGLKLLNGWTSTSDYGFSTGNNSGIYPDNVIRTFYSDNSSTSKRIKINGLRAGYMYNFIFFASWKNPWSKAITEYSIGDKTVSLDPANNQTKEVRIDYILGDDNGEAIINIQKQAGSSYVFLNSLIIEELPLLNSAIVQEPANITSSNIVVDSSKELMIKVFPNPFKENIYIDLGSYDIKSNDLIYIELLDLNGRILKVKKLQNEALNEIIDFDVKDLYLNTGMYLIRLSGNNMQPQIFKTQKQN